MIPVDAGWGSWSSWSRYSSCSVTCGAGSERYKRKRYCNNPVAKNGGISCSGQRYSYEYRNCYRSKCPSKSYQTVHSKVVLVYIELPVKVYITCILTFGTLVCAIGYFVLSNIMYIVHVGNRGV